MNEPNFQRFSIIITTWRRDDLLKDCLDSLLKVYGGLPEIVIVDNAREKSTLELCARYEGLRYVAAEGNLGFAGGNNLGMRQCHREYVILLNNDTIFREDSINPLVDFMDAHPQVALAQGRAVYADAPTMTDGCGIFLTSIGMTEYPGDRGAVGGPCDVTRPMPAGGGPFCIFRMSALADVGGELYHDFYWAYFEDVDLSFRSWRSGHEFWYVSTPPVLHRKNVTAKMFPSEKILGQLYFNMAATYYTCFGLSGWLRFFAIRCSCYFIKAVALSVRLQPEYARIHLRVLSRLWRERKTLAALHAHLRKTRKLSDLEMLRKFRALKAGQGDGTVNASKRRPPRDPADELQLAGRFRPQRAIASMLSFLKHLHSQHARIGVRRV